MTPTLTTEPTTAEVIAAARDLMAEHGWTQGQYFVKTPETDAGDHAWGVTVEGEYCAGSMCLEGALRAAVVKLYGWGAGNLGHADEDYYNTQSIRDAAAARAYYVVRDVLGIPHTFDDAVHAVATECVSIPQWNDRVCTSQDEALDVLATAAVKAQPDDA